MSSNDASITISIIAKDLASGNIGKAVSGLDALAKKGGLAGAMAQGVGQSFGQMLNPIGLATKAIGAVTDFLGDAARAAMDEEANIRQLDVALKNNVDGWDGNTDAIEAQIKKRQLLAFSDDALRDSLGKLVVRTHDVAEAERLQGLAMDLARGKGIDLAAATDLIGKASSGQVSALRRAGIAIDANATSTEALAAVEKAYHGQAEAYAETTAGAMESTQIALQDVTEDIGAMLLPLLKDLALFVRDTLLPALGTIGDVLGTIGGVAHEVLNIITLGGLNAKEALEGLVNEVKAIQEEYGVSEEQLRSWMEAHPDLVAAAGQDYVKLADLARTAAKEIAAEWEEDHLRAAGSIGARAMIDGAEAVIVASTPDLAEAMGEAIDVGLVDVIRASKDKTADAMDDLKWAMLHPLEGMARLAEIQGQLTGTLLAEGLASENPFVRSQAEATRQILIDEWQKISGVAYDAGYDAQTEYNQGLRDAPRPNPQDPRFVGGLNNRQRDTYNRGADRAGGLAHGGRAAPYSMHEVVETGDPEMLQIGDRAYLMMGSRGGDVTPLDAGGYAGGRSAGGLGGGDVHLHLSVQSFVPPSGAEMQRLAAFLIPELRRELNRQRF